MSNKMRLVERLSGHLRKNQQEKYTARQLAQWFLQSFPEACQSKIQASKNINSDAELLEQLRAEVSRIKNIPQIKATAGKPKKYYWSEETDSAEIAAIEAEKMVLSGSTEPIKRDEYSLYPLLIQFLFDEYKLYCKRIDEKRSGNTQGRGANHWLHPDIVALQDIGEVWKQAVKNCAAQSVAKRARLWSFEVKLLLNRSNIREAYFQTLSNSSWANFAYLVAGQISQDCMQELTMLSAAHGISVILLDCDNTEESQILIPARERDAIDWDMVNRLTEENGDFIEYVDLITQFYQTGKTSKKFWDIP